MVATKRKRSKTLTILLFPVLAIIFIIGFCMYYIGDREKPKTKTASKQSNKDDISILPIILEEQEEKIQA